VIDADLPDPEVEIAYLRYRPTRSLLVVYEVRLGDTAHDVFALADARADLAARAAAPESTALVAKLAARTPADTPLAYVHELDALVHWLPLDLALPAMAEPPERLRERLVEVGLDLDVDDVPRTVKHKPMMRGVLRLNDHFAKAFPDRDSFDESVHNLELSASLPFPTARCTAVIPELMIAAQSRVAGERPGDAAEVASQAGALLAVLHATPYATSRLSFRGSSQRRRQKAASLDYRSRSRRWRPSWERLEDWRSQRRAGIEPRRLPQQPAAPERRRARRDRLRRDVPRAGCG
jgi:hypothetical protein